MSLKNLIGAGILTFGSLLSNSDEAKSQDYVVPYSAPFVIQPEIVIPGTPFYPFPSETIIPQGFLLEERVIVPSISFQPIYSVPYRVIYPIPYHPIPDTSKANSLFEKTKDFWSNKDNGILWFKRNGEYIFANSRDDSRDGEAMGFDSQDLKKGFYGLSHSSLHPDVLNLTFYDRIQNVRNSNGSSYKVSFPEKNKMTFHLKDGKSISYNRVHLTHPERTFPSEFRLD